MEETVKTKFGKRCGEKILDEAVICPKCGCQVESMNNGSQPQIVVNNSNVANANANACVNAGGVDVGRLKDKWVAFFLCLFFWIFWRS